jgi:hypothetical protein
MENPALRKYYHLDENTTGNLITHVVYNSSAKGVLKEGDILLAIDGKKIENDGTVAFRRHEYTSLYYYLDLHQMGDDVKLDIIREKKRMQVKVKLKRIADEMILIKTTRYDTMPRYYIFGGYVFSPLTRNLLNRSGNRIGLLKYLVMRPSKEKKEVVVLLKVLADKINRGYYDLDFWVVEKINGKTFDSFDTFFRMMQNIRKRYIVLEDERGVKVIIDRLEAEARQAAILKKYNIEFDRSADLRNGSSNTKITQ